MIRRVATDLCICTHEEKEATTLAGKLQHSIGSDAAQYTRVCAMPDRRVTFDRVSHGLFEAAIMDENYDGCRRSRA